MTLGHQPEDLGMDRRTMKKLIDELRECYTALTPQERKYLTDALRTDASEGRKETFFEITEQQYVAYSTYLKNNGLHCEHWKPGTLLIWGWAE